MPNERFDAWQEILVEWKRVRRMKRLIQELYDQVGGTFFFMLEYAKKNDITLPNRDALYQMADRIHKQMDEIESSRSDEDLTEPFCVYVAVAHIVIWSAYRISRHIYYFKTIDGSREL
jgi:hypothetical protein